MVATSANNYMDILGEYPKNDTDIYPNSSDFWQDLLLAYWMVFVPWFLQITFWDFVSY
jgi:hypothetical protein